MKLFLHHRMVFNRVSETDLLLKLVWTECVLEDRQLILFGFASYSELTKFAISTS